MKVPTGICVTDSEHRLLLEGELDYKNNGQTVYCFLFSDALLLTKRRERKKQKSKSKRVSVPPKLRRGLSFDTMLPTGCERYKFASYLSLRDGSTIKPYPDHIFSFQESSSAPSHFCQSNQPEWSAVINQLSMKMGCSRSPSPSLLPAGSSISEAVLGILPTHTKAQTSYSTELSHTVSKLSRPWFREPPPRITHGVCNLQISATKSELQPLHPLNALLELKLQLFGEKLALSRKLECPTAST